MHVACKGPCAYGVLPNVFTRGEVEVLGFSIVQKNSIPSFAIPSLISLLAQKTIWILECMWLARVCVHLEFYLISSLDERWRSWGSPSSKKISPHPSQYRPQFLLIWILGENSRRLNNLFRWEIFYSTRLWVEFVENEMSNRWINLQSLSIILVLWF